MTRYPYLAAEHQHPPAFWPAMGRMFRFYATFGPLREHGLRAALHALHQGLAVLALALGPLVAPVLAPLSVWASYRHWRDQHEAENARQWRNRLQTAKAGLKWAVGMNEASLIDAAQSDLQYLLDNPPAVREPRGPWARRLWVALAAGLGGSVAFWNLMQAAQTAHNGQWGFTAACTLTGLFLLRCTRNVIRP